MRTRMEELVLLEYNRERVRQGAPSS